MSFVTRTSTRKAALGGVASLGAIALIAGCGSAPEDEGSGGGGSSDFLPCMVSDSGGFDDKSFNQLGFEGLTEASEELGVEPRTVESASPTDYGPNINNLVDQGCNLIVTVGFDLADATKVAAEANSDIDFAIIDDSSIDLPNVKPLTYDASQSAFLAGYAAGYDPARQPGLESFTAAAALHGLAAVRARSSDASAIADCLKINTARCQKKQTTMFNEV